MEALAREADIQASGDIAFEMPRPRLTPRPPQRSCWLIALTAI
jgi:hypothetical protein